jgi:hypothetical protein
MAIICPDHNLLFIMTPRTACTAVGVALREQLGGVYLPEQDLLDDKGNFRIQRKHSTLKELLDAGVLTRADADKLLVFTTVRNPFDNLASRYEKLRSKYQPLLDDPDTWVHKIPGYVNDMRYCQTHTFNEWIFKHYVRTAIKRLLCGRPSMYASFTEGVDAVIHFENLQEDIDRLGANAHTPFSLSVPVINPTQQRNNDYRQYYNKASRLLIEFSLHRDLKQYGYSF